MTAAPHITQSYKALPFTFSLVIPSVLIVGNDISVLTLNAIDPTMYA